jgi:hypothetical protein
MPRIQSPWHKWRVSWRHVPWFVVSVAGIWGSWRLIRSGDVVPGSFLLLVSLAFLGGSSKTLWRTRQLFVFAVRGNRKVRFRGGGRDEINFEENGRKVKIYTELLGGKVSRAIHVSSIEKYEPPYDGELLTDKQREEILDLLCEEYDYRGIRYEVVMSSKLTVRMPCPRCKEEQELQLQLPFGCIGERHYKIGDKVEWQASRLSEKGGRPDNGNLRKEVWSKCPTCRRDSWMIVTVSEDKIEKVDVNSSRTVMIPDDSIPIVEDGKIVAHRIEPKKRRGWL